MRCLGYHEPKGGSGSLPIAMLAAIPQGTFRVAEVCGRKRFSLSWSMDDRDASQRSTQRQIHLYIYVCIYIYVYIYIYIYMVFKPFKR